MVYNLIKLYGENSLQNSYSDTTGVATFDESEQEGFLTYLPDATTATVTEEINNQYDLVINYPVTGAGYDFIEINRIIACKPNPHSSVQGFRIYKISKPIDGIVEITANHISYDLNGYILNPFTVENKTPDEVINAIGEHSSTTCPFTFSSDINKTVSKFAVSKPISIREMLGGKLSNELSLIQTTSGEFEFDNLHVSLKQARGSNNGVRISYGKNLTDFRYDEDSTPFYTGVYPYWMTTKKPDSQNQTTSSSSTVSVSNQQLFEATAQYGNMNLVLSVSKGSTSGSNTTLTWSLYFKIVVVGGYHFRYQNSCSVTINGTKIFSSGNVKEIDIHGMSVGQTVQLANGTTTVPSSKVSVPVSATFIQLQDTRGTWKISGNYAITGGTEVVTNVETDDIYYCVTLDGNDKIHNYETDAKIKKLYALDLSKDIEIPKDDKGNYIYPDNTSAGQQARTNIRNQLNTAFQRYLSEHDAPIVNDDSLEVSFVDLAQSTEYGDYAALETVNIGDIVTVDFPIYGVSKSKECVKTEYDVLSDSYITLTLGELTDTLASTIQNGVSLAQRSTANMQQLANSVNANFNSIEALNIRAGTIQADYVIVNERLTAAEADIGSLTADYGSFKTLTAGSFTAVNASITNLSTVYATISDLSATNATISNLSTVYATISNLSATNATISNLSTVYATISSLSATNAAISNLSTVYATISSLSATNATISNLSTVYATISSMEAGFASINSLFANYASLEYLSAHYAEIDFANISIANVSSLFAIAGIISDLTIASGHLTGELQFVTLSGDLIEVGTLVADRIVMLGADGLYYQLNTNGETVGASQTEYNSLHGDVITAQSITADKIYVTDLYAFGATIGTLTIDQSSIHTVTKDSVTSGNTGIFISPTAFAIGNATNKLTYNADGQNTLEVTGTIRASSGDIAGWIISETQIKRSFTYSSGTTWAGDYYSAYLNTMPDGFIDGSDPEYPTGRDPATVDAFAVYTKANGATSGSYPFRVGYDGTLRATKAEITGTITASGGSIANWVISTNSLRKEYVLSGDSYSGLTYVAQVGGSVSPSNTVYLLRHYPTETPSDFTNDFYVTFDGRMYAASATVKGSITANSGYIGGTTGWVITTGKIYKGTAGSASGIHLNALGNTTAAIAGASRSNLMLCVGANFGVNTSGNLYASGATISGAITATSGTFGASSGARLQVSGTNINVLGNGGSVRAYLSAVSGYFIIHGTTGVQIDGVLVNENAYTQSSSGGRTVLVTSGGTFGTSASSRRYKKDILAVSDDFFDGLLSVKASEYKYTNLRKGDDWYDVRVPGLIAEDVADVLPIGVFRDKNGLVEDWNDRIVLVGTLSLLQKLYRRVDELERKLAIYDK